METFMEMAKLSDEEVNSAINMTIGQSGNTNWLIARKHRLTASHFGRDLSACKINRYPISLFKSLLNAYNMEGIKVIQWGKENEPLALAHLEQEFSVKVSPTGLWLDDCGFISASPHGLMGTDSIVEAKCPYKFRDISLLEYD
ncbi:hypothetical protein MML48_9g00004752 [Holotrichia oblita]|uniref:Uncharacterized protein n=1 Tax=Holotrichia oblita TaxID=644536 RepID=A0ACB9SJ52_HOLOL|nr:hypothetical protein MML48_9g00004752 [Holotrichia oblita]